MKLTIKDYKAIVENQKKQIEYLKDTIENYDSLQRCKCCDCIENAIQDYSDLMFKVMPFDDDYFKNLTYEQIAELAKKSIRLTDDNCKMMHKLKDIAEILDSSELYEKIRKIIESEDTNEPN